MSTGFPFGCEDMNDPTLKIRRNIRAGIDSAICKCSQIKQLHREGLDHFRDFKETLSQQVFAARASQERRVRGLAVATSEPGEAPGWQIQLTLPGLFVCWVCRILRGLVHAIDFASGWFRKPLDGGGSR